MTINLAKPSDPRAIPSARAGLSVVGTVNLSKPAKPAQAPRPATPQEPRGSILRASQPVRASQSRPTRKGTPTGRLETLERRRARAAKTGAVALTRNGRTVNAKRMGL